MSTHNLFVWEINGWPDILPDGYFDKFTIKRMKFLPKRHSAEGIINRKDILPECYFRKLGMRKRTTMLLMLLDCMLLDSNGVFSLKIPGFLVLKTVNCSSQPLRF